MPDRTTVVIPPRLKQRAIALARHRGISFSEFVRRSLETAVVDAPLAKSRKKDPLFGNVPVYRGPAPADFSTNHDKYLYDDE
jgi:hypothetical protein